MLEQEANSISAVEPPHGIIGASVDEKGRLKVPSEFIEYMEKSGATKVFITTLDLRTVRIYPLALWKHNENLLGNAGANSAAAERLARFVKHYGGDAELKDGRLLLPQLLRQEMSLEKQLVCVDAHAGRINVVSKKIHEELMQVSKASVMDDLRTFEEIGFK